LTNRNKRSITLNLKSPRGQEILRKLVGWADVLVVNYPPHVRERLTLTYEDISAINPRIIYADITGYGDYGPDADEPGFDITAYWARTGLMDAMRNAGCPPALPVPGLGDQATAMTLYASILTGIYRRERRVRVAIFTGAGQKAFSAGNDLKATAAATARGEKPTLLDVPFGGITSGFECDKPIIAAVNGFALGGGFEIAQACDLIIAVEHASFGQPEPRMGLIAGAGGVHRLPAQIPLKQAMGLLLTGRQITAQEAYRLGLVNEIVPAAQLMAAAERWANEIMECSPLSVRLTKEAVLARLSLPVEEAMRQDRPHLQRLFTSQDFVEGPKAFAEKRKSRWTGR
jgi:enoyl-CoA hydratase/carnithine racemase